MFKILKKSKMSKARLGRLATTHGDIRTPFFMPDATRAAVKGLASDDLRALGLEALVINAYHLLLRPGAEIVKRAPGAHKFMNWAGPLCSDSGGFQVFSLLRNNRARRHAELVSASGSRNKFGMTMGKITDDKVIFRSLLDGSLRELTPEKSIQIQFDLGADMIVCLDDCPPHNLSPRDMEKSVARTIAWARRCKNEYERLVKKNRLRAKRPLLFGVIQGGIDLSLRKKCAAALLSIGFDGYGLGARPVDINGKFLTKIISGVADSIPENKLRFALGTGAPADIIKSVKAGWDAFDCVIPTREGRHGRLYLWRTNSRHAELVSASGNKRSRNKFGMTINITNSRFARDFSPINPNSGLIELRENSRAYLHHLFGAGEPQAGRLATLNNLEFYLDLMKTIRVAIRKNLL